MEPESILANKGLNSQSSVYGQREVVQEERLRPNFTKAELDSAVLPKRIAKEIRSEKYWILFLNILGTVGLITSAFFLLAWYVPDPVVNAETGLTTKWLIDVSYLPQPWLMFIILAAGLVLFILSWIEYAHIISSVNRYKGDILMNVSSIPYFLVKSYRSIVARVVYVNWISGAIYVGSAISIGVMFAISAISPAMPLTTEKNITYIILGSTLAFQLITLIFIKYRKGNLNNFYGKDLISLEDQKLITKTANRRCLFTFVVVISVILVFIVIPWMLIRRKKGLKMVPFL